jgi:GAF domain-containing protein/HAMP domain-containing protein
MNSQSKPPQKGFIQQNRIFREFNNFNLRTKFIISFLVVAIISTLGVGIITNIIIQTELKNQLGITLKSLAHAQATLIGEDLANQIELIQTLALNEKVAQSLQAINSSYKGNPEEIQANIMLRDKQWMAADAAKNNNDPLVQQILSSSVSNDLIAFQKSNPNHVELFLTDKYGAVVAATDRISGFAQSQDPWWQAAFNNGSGGVFFGQPEFDESTQTFICPIAVPAVVNDSGEVIGVLRTNYRLSGIADSLSHIKLANTGYDTLVFPNGEILTPDGTRATLDPELVKKIKSTVSAFNQLEFQGKERILSVSPVSPLTSKFPAVENLNWTLITAQDTTEALRAVTVAAQSTLFISLGALLAAAILAVLMSQYLSDPITRLTQAAILVQNGDLNFRARVESQDEIGALAGSFNAMTAELQDTLIGLEQRVADRTTDLEHRSKELSDRTVQLEIANIRSQRRASQFQAIADAARTIALIRKLGDLLPRITRVVSEQFGFYHTGIFLLDEAGQYAILSAASSEGGRQMVARGHRLKVGEQGIVGYVTGTGAPRIALDTGMDSVFFNNPNLPETRSEMAVPLKSGGEIIGALDIQSKQSNAFNQEDIEVIQILADQISIAIDNARQFEQSQRSLAEVETIYRQYLRQEWGHIDVSDDPLGYRHTITGTQALDKALVIDRNLQNLKSDTILSEIDPETKESTLRVPIMLRDEAIGVLTVRSQKNRAWNDDEINSIKSVADRVAISAENARLFEETSKRAERERTVSQITSKIRSTNDPNEMIHIALNELKQALHIKDVRVIPYTPPQSQEKS